MKKLLAIVLAVVLVVAMVPVSTSAATSGTLGDNVTWTVDDDGVLTISGSGKMDFFTYAPWSSHIQKITSVVIEPGITTIGARSFYECSALKNVSIPNTVTDIGESAFCLCTSLKSITLPDSVTTLGQNIFNTCSSLESVTLPNGITEIAGYMFWDCGVLTAVAIPDSVTSIGDWSFGRCAALKSVNIPDGVTIIKERAFYCCDSLAEVTIPQSVTEIGYQAFYSCFALKSVTLPDGVATIGKGAFAACTSLERITVPKSVTDIDPTAFNNSKALTIYGYTGSTAEAHAKEYNIPFVALDATNAPEFTDVKEGQWFYNPVQWAVANGITSGTSDTTFSPGNKCTRAQAVTFLWNAKGQPEPESKENPFTDVKSTAWYYKAVLWAVENNITSGTSPTTFSPNSTCTRGQIVTFFHNFAEKPSVSGSNPFKDVEAGKWYYQPILWAVEKGVTAGIGNGNFGPNNTCTRGQIVTFLYNYLGKE